MSSSLNMKILFIVTSYWSFGEMEIAVQFAKGISNRESVLFWVPRKHETYVKAQGFQTVPLYFNMPKLNRIMLKNIQDSFSPDFIVLSDYLNYIFCERHYGLTLDDLEIFPGHVGCFDLYNQIGLPRRMDTYGFRGKLIELNEREINFFIHPCPLLDASINEPAENRFAVSLVDKIALRSEEEKKHAKSSLGLPMNKKVILTTKALWQTTYKKYPKAKQFVETSEAIFRNLLAELAKDYYVVVIGAEEKMGDGIQFLHSLPPNVFESYINSADLFLSRNIISTSFAKVILRGIEGVVLVNSHDNEGYKCKMYPVGWYDYIAPIENGNSYFQCFEQYEMFDADASLLKIQDALETKANHESLLDYHEQLKRLNSPQDIFLKIEGMI